jgi:hypothetical protein
LLDGVLFDPFSLYNYCSPAQGEHFFAGVAQLVEQLIRNQQVSGSSPLAGLKINKLARPTGPGFLILWALNPSHMPVTMQIRIFSARFCGLFRKLAQVDAGVTPAKP